MHASKDSRNILELNRALVFSQEASAGFGVRVAMAND
jgi:hypothetical protein